MSTGRLAPIKARLQTLAHADTAKALQWFFKTGPGQYGEGDVFIGIKVPVLRTVAKEFRNAAPTTLRSLLKSKIHEERTLALMILVLQFQKADAMRQREIYDFYLEHSKFVNNWDLVDGSAPYIVGPILFHGDRTRLYTLARSVSIWERRIAILSTLYFIRQNDFADTLKLSEVLLTDDHDLIHKAVGWMLREVGKRDQKVLENFLKKHYRQMPRTALRYAIERFPEPRWKKYLLGRV